MSFSVCRAAKKYRRSAAVHCRAFTELQQQLSREDGRQQVRPRTQGNGSGGEVRTDC
ncbi:hypothetical protein Pvag_2699 [Pantoea vagans C9-1]|nr:hypothetical protein [Pantoea vagans]ADO10858.1 hypothetical protein Pvag_2699 [Pantoea vagans C9-1]